MEHRNQFTEEMLRQMYQRRGYQVMRLCGEVSDDRQRVMELTFQVFGEAHRQLSSSSEEMTVELQDAVLLECTRRLLQSVVPAAPLQKEEPPLQDEPFSPAHEEDLSVLEELSPVEEPAAEEPLTVGEPDEELPVQEEAEPSEHPHETAEAEESEPSRTMVEKFNDMQAEQEPLDLTDTSGSSFGWSLLVFVLVLVIIALLWAIWGVAQTIFPIPQLDLGYQWFNANVYPLF